MLGVEPKVVPKFCRMFKLEGSLWELQHNRRRRGNILLAPARKVNLCAGESPADDSFYGTEIFHYLTFREKRVDLVEGVGRSRCRARQGQLYITGKFLGG